MAEGVVRSQPVRTFGAWPRRLGRAVAGIVGLAVAIPVLAAGYEVVASLADALTDPAPGRLVDIGGRRLHINCLGEGSPTILLEAGLGGYSDSWLLVQSEAAKLTRTCSYDRAGYG